MKNSIDPIRLELRNQAIQKLSSLQLRNKVVSDTSLDPCRRGSPIRIEEKTLWTFDSRSGYCVDDKPAKIYYQKPPLTRQGKIDYKRFADEILLRRLKDWGL